MYNTNITDKNNDHLEDWAEASYEIGTLRKLGVPGQVIDTIEGDIATYVEDHGIDYFNDIPESEIVAAIADNTDTQTRLHILWECSEAVLWGTHHQDPYDQFDTPTYTEPIDRDQAVDEDGKAIYGDYTLTIDVSGPGDMYSEGRYYDFSAADIEEFARTW